MRKIRSGKNSFAAMPGEKKINIAIDGYSACGKSTLARGLADALGYLYIDSGAMYRALTWYFIEKGIGIGDIEAIRAELADIDVRLERRGNQLITRVNGRDVSEEIRRMDVSEKVSEISTLPELRAKLVTLQRAMAREGGVVMDGRDIGTVVMPEADIKIFMTADFDVRVKRRMEELKEKGIEAGYEEVAENLRHRDQIDSSRKVSPLKKAEDAVLFDNSELTRVQQLTWARNWAEVRLTM